MVESVVGCVVMVRCDSQLLLLLTMSMSYLGLAPVSHRFPCLSHMQRLRVTQTLR